MEQLPAQERLYPYYSEVVEPVELSEEDYERGRALIEGITGLGRALDGVGDLHFNCTVSSSSDGIMVVEPQSDVERIVRAMDAFYGRGVKPETTESMKPLIFSYFEAWEQDGTSVILVKGYSPSYEVRTPGYESLPLVETCTFDPTQHRVAIHLKKRN